MSELRDEITFPVGESDYSPYKVGFNPYGEGLILLVDRGIPCEAHTQVFSAHATNTPEDQDILAELKENRGHYRTVLDRFVDLMEAMNMGKTWSHGTREEIGSLFCSWLIKRITESSEQRMYSRMEKEHQTQNGENNE